MNCLFNQVASVALLVKALVIYKKDVDIEPISVVENDLYSRASSTDSFLKKNRKNLRSMRKNNYFIVNLTFFMRVSHPRTISSISLFLFS